MTCAAPPVATADTADAAAANPLLAEIGDAQAQAETRERFGRGKTDAGRTAGYNGHGTGRQGRMGQG